MSSEKDREERTTRSSPPPGVEASEARDADEDEDERDEDGAAAEAVARQATEESGPDPNAPRNRAERRAAAKAARRGRPSTVEAEPRAEADAVPGATGRRPRVPPRTMSKGTGDVEGVPEWARRAGEYLALHRRTLAVGALVVVGSLGGALGWNRHVLTREAGATAAYTRALEAMVAEVSTSETPPPENAPPRRGPRFASYERRTEEVVRRFREVEQRFPRSRVAPLARLGEASALYQLGGREHLLDARRLYQSILGADVAGLEGRALEGLAFTLESLGELDAALARYRELQNVQGGAWRDQAQYYQARLLTRQGNNTRAKEILHALVERLRHVSTTDPAGAASLELREQAINLLRDVDPTDPAVVARDRENAESDHGHGRGPSGGMPGLENLPPELREQLMRALQKQGRGR